MNITTPNNMIDTMLSEMVSKVMPAASTSMMVLAEGLMGSGTVIFWSELSPNEDGGDGKIFMVLEIIFGLLDFVFVVFLVALIPLVVAVVVVVVVVVVIVVVIVVVVVVVVVVLV